MPDKIIEMLLSKLNINPEKLKADFMTAQKQVRDTITYFDGRLKRIEQQNAEILALLTQRRITDGTTDDSDGGTNSGAD